MPTRDNGKNEEIVKAKQRREQQAGPEADATGDASSLLSALGNSGVQRLMRSAALHRAADGSGTVDEAVAKQIQAKRGAGQPLDEGVRRQMEPSLGQDFSDVRVHADGEADALNRAVKAEAFTTGKDIFFRSGKYNPGSSDGQKLLAHELTHVVQQGSAPPASEMTVSSPDDASEREAGRVADSFNAGGQAAVSRQAAGEEEEEMMQSPIERQAAGEEEEEMMQSPLERQPMEEEEQEMMQSPLERQPMEEEEQEMMQSPLERQPMEEEEMMQPSLERQETEEGEESAQA